MSKAYDRYLKEHIEAVQSGWKWFVEKVGIKKLTEVLPDLDATNIDITVSTHDYSKKWYEEYHAYDHYFYGSRGIKQDGGPDDDVERDFNYAWLHHIHMNEHHWQHWVLIHDDIETNGDPANTIITMLPNGQQICMTVLEMPDYYILEMVCDWWSFSWRKGDLYEIFNWWNEQEILLGEKTREKVMKLLNLIAEKLSEYDGGDDEDDDAARHSGVLGQKWGVRNGPPYPLNTQAKLNNVGRLNDLMNTNWDYGYLGKNGEHVTDTEGYDWDKNYRTTPIETLKKEQIGTCWDFVNYQHHALNEMGIKNNAYMMFIQRSPDPKDAVTHTFTTFELDGKQYWLESAAWPKRGVHEISSWRDVVKELNDMYHNTEYGYSIFEYNPDGMDKGLTTDEFVEKATQNYVHDEPGKYTNSH